MKKLILLFLVMNFILLSGVCFAKSSKLNVPEDIRVGLFYASSAKSSITLSSPGGIEIGTMRNGEFTFEDEALKYETITVQKSSIPGAVYIEGYGDIGSANDYPYFKSIEKDGISLMIVNGTKYRGNIEIRRFSDSDMTVINHVTMQEYLYGVVPREIGGNSPIEAVKAQAIVARTYACKNYGKRSKLGFDVMPTVDDQAYGGYEWEVANSNKAVDETYGQVVVYDGDLIGGYYFSTSGGYTENSENVWTSSVDYLKAVPDTYEPEIEGNTTWEVTMSADEVKSKLQKNGINVGDIIDLEPVEYTDAGRILELKVVGTTGEKIISKSSVRSYLGLKSQWYSINDEAPQVITKVSTPQAVTEIVEDENSDPEWFLKYDEEKINEVTTDYASEEKNFVKEIDEKIDESNDKKINVATTEEEYEEQNIKISRKPLLNSICSFISEGLSDIVYGNDGVQTQSKKYEASSSKNSFVFRGRGWGHAVGMSQNGAKGMAKAGFSAEEIIKWYYTGVSIEK